MKKNKPDSSFTNPLREKAEVKINRQVNLEDFSVDKLKELLHELQVHEIELEMQNEELIRSNIEIESLLTKYHDLYEFAPVGFLTIDENGIIEEANLTASVIIGKERRFLIKKRFQSFLNFKFSEHFYLFLREVFKSDKKENIDIQIQPKEAEERWVQLDGVVISKGGKGLKKCRLAITDITERKKAAELIRTSLEDKKRMKIILKTQEEERSRFAESLHNGLGQMLYAIKLRLEHFGIEGNKESQIAEKAKIDHLLGEAISETARISYELVPRLLQDFGLIEAIKELINRIPSEKLPIQFLHKGFEKRIDPDIEIALFRIIQELCSNIIKHSKAKSANVYLLRSETLIRLIVEDTGIGFNINERELQPSGLGLKGIKGRVLLLKGKTEIFSEPLKGTKFVIEIPRS